MTNREFYSNIVNGNITEEVVAHAATAIEKLDAALEARKNKPSKKATENAPVLEAITGILTSEPAVASDIATAAGISTQKASALLRQLVATGVAVQTEVKVPKKGTVKAYALATVEA
jgi:sRNA-binding protein